MPKGAIRRGGARSLAQIRMNVEELLRRREAPSPEAWRELGPEAEDVLVQLVDDPAIARQEALRQRVIATLGQLGVAATTPRLGAILRDRSEPPLTRAYAASALGTMGDPQCISELARAVLDRDEIVRRRVAVALGRIHHTDAVPHLLRLAKDRSPEIAEIAMTELKAFEKELGTKFDVKARPPRRRERPKGPIAPPEE
jgi:HEAT repeat protein